jgi:hypothetical protein
MSFGIGAFPFGFFASSLTGNINDGRPPQRKYIIKSLKNVQSFVVFNDLITCFYM